ncbi:hypothetical protein QE372_002649 [Agrobacterium pusense]|uniref:hypothetical protein n=1 Tax=Agrobacterium pusense TaxID=648995 RepID=UPI00285EBB5B|nr:hypothetical protein [Agrobacterium pusense]MDR6190381.1 hypothetical protein [Agrobacterium pusense]
MAEQNIYLDTALLAVPNYAIDAESAQQLIDRVLHFSDVATLDTKFPLRLVVSSTAEETLWGSNCAPDKKEIADFLEIMDVLDFYTPRDLFRSYNSILDRASRSEEICSIEVKSVTDVTIEPEIPDHLSPHGLVGETHRVMSTVAALCARNEAWVVGSSLNAEGPSRHLVSATSLDDGMPVDVTGTVTSIANFRDLISTHQAFWEQASSDEELYYAIALGALSLRKANGLNDELEGLKKFRLGPGFSTSLSTHQCCGSGQYSSATRVLLSQIVAQLCNRKIGHFGRPHQEIRSFDGARAYRVQLTKGQLALRLMYWEADGVIEFSNVGVKHELEILVGSVGDYVELDFKTVISG